MCPFTGNCKFFTFFQQSDNLHVTESIKKFCRDEQAWHGCIRTLILRTDEQIYLAADMGPEGKRMYYEKG